VAPPDTVATRPALRAAVERYMDRRLAARDLSVEAVAAAHGVSVRTINRLFSESAETFSAALRSKRLARVREELVAGESSVAGLAQRWGFFDASHLTRSFRAQYGLTPRDYRRRGREHSEAPVALG
jgi:AraC-like DNA-binding protein